MAMEVDEIKDSLKPKSKEMYIIRVIVIGILIGVFLNSCKRNKDFSSPLNRFYANFENQVDEQLLESFKEASEDSLVQYYNIFFETAIKILKSDLELDEMFESKKVFLDGNKLYILLKSHHRKLNKEEVQFLELVKEVVEHVEQAKSSRDQEIKCYRERVEIAKANFKNWEVGDTINISLPIDFNDGVKNAFYYGCPSDYDGKNTEDYLSITGILAQKNTSVHNDYGNVYDSLMLRFDISIIDRSDNNTLVLLQTLNIGDNFSLDLNSYGRFIK